MLPGHEDIFDPAGNEAAKASGAGLIGAYTSTLFLTLTNPATILSFSFIFPGFGVQINNYGQATVVVGGVFVDSALASGWSPC